MDDKLTTPRTEPDPTAGERLTPDQLLAEQQIIRERAERVRRELSMNQAYLPPQFPPGADDGR